MRKILFIVLGLALATGGAVHFGVFRGEIASADDCPPAWGAGKVLAFSSPFTIGVPNGCYKMKVEIWGAGGNSWPTGGGVGRTHEAGGGGYTVSIFDVQPGQTYLLSPGSATSGAGAGGQRSKVTRTVPGPSIDLIIAGGGGGSGAALSTDVVPGDGGGGGGLVGREGGWTGYTVGDTEYYAEGGQGGQEGGIGGYGGLNWLNPNCNGWSATGPVGGGVQCAFAGSGGHGYAGGGGGAAIGPGGTAGAGGGGGSSFINPAAGPDSVAKTYGFGGRQIPGFDSNPDRLWNAGWGGDGPTANDTTYRGINGLVVVTFNEDIQIDDSNYPTGANPSFCGGILVVKPPQSGTFPMSIHPPTCSQTHATCRRAYFGSGYVCRYACHDPDTQNPGFAFAYRCAGF